METLKEALRVLRSIGYAKEADYLEKTFTEVDFNSPFDKQGPLDFFFWHLHSDACLNWKKLNNALLIYTGKYTADV